MRDERVGVAANLSLLALSPQSIPPTLSHTFVLSRSLRVVENFAHRSLVAPEDEKVSRLVGMGFEADAATAALRAAGGDETAALEALLTGA